MGLHIYRLQCQTLLLLKQWLVVLCGPTCNIINLLLKFILLLYGLSSHAQYNNMQPFKEI